MKLFSAVLISSFSVFLSLVPSANAQTFVFQPVSATTTYTSTIGGGLGGTFNQSGLSSGYASGTTDFSTYEASNPTHATQFGDEGFFQPGGAGRIDYNLGQVLFIESFGLWNHADSNLATLRGVNNFEIFTSSDGNFATATSVGSFSATAASGVNTLQVFDVTDTTGQFVHLNILSNGGNSFATVLSEVVVGGSEVVPEPTTILGTLLAVGLGALTAIKRKLSSDNHKQQYK